MSTAPPPSTPNGAASLSLPSWARDAVQLYESNAASQFILYGNVYDQLLIPSPSGSLLGTLNDFLLVAEWLESHPAVARVYYPGLPSFPQYELARRQQSGYGGMISFELDAPSSTAIAALNAVQLCSRAESLGGVETLITHPASTTHADLSPGLREHLGISDGLIRLSVGLESASDIIADLEQAFAAAGCGCKTKGAANEIR